MGADVGVVGGEEMNVVTRSRNVGFGGGLRNAIAKSLSDVGDDGVTIIAGSGDFSSTSGSDRSAARGDNELHLILALSFCCTYRGARE